jgi:hypothetical protein
MRLEDIGAPAGSKSLRSRRHIAGVSAGVIVQIHSSAERSRGRRRLSLCANSGSGGKSNRAFACASMR